MNRTLARLYKEERSVTAVEFGMIAPVLFLFLFSIILLGVVQFWQLTLDDAVRNTTRQVTIGAVSKGTGVHTSAEFVTSICNEFGQAAPACASTLQYSVQTAVTFSAITPATFSSAGALSGSPAFPSQLTTSWPILVQVAYPVPISIPLLPMKLVTLDGTPSIISADAMVTEP